MLEKCCSCGGVMPMKLRTVVYSNTVEIDNVPIYSCSSCNRSEVFAEVQPDLSGLIGKLGAQPVKQTFLFNEWNEWAKLLVEMYYGSKHTDPVTVKRMTADRIDMLLDLLVVAKSFNDEEWQADLNKRLSQLSRSMLQYG